MKEFLYIFSILEYQNIPFYLWIIIFIVRSWLNGGIYEELDNEDIKSLYSFSKPDHTATILMFFTFWWQEYQTESNPKIRKKMIVANILHLFFIFYTCLFIIYTYYY